MKEFSLHLKVPHLDSSIIVQAATYPIMLYTCRPAGALGDLGYWYSIYVPAPLGLKGEVVSCTYKYNLNQLHAYRVLYLRGRVDAVHHQSVSGGDVGILEPSICGGAELE